MRRKDREITDQEILKGIMEEAMVCRIGMCDGDAPYVIPANFGIDFDGDKMTVYLHSAKEGRKIDILKKNNKVCIEAETRAEIVPAEIACDWSMNFCSVIGKGKAYLIEDIEEKKYGLDCIMRKYSKENHFTYQEAMLKSVAIIRIELDELTGKKRG